MKIGLIKMHFTKKKSRLYHGNFPCRGKIPLVTMVWIVSRFRLKVETSFTRIEKSVNSD